MSSKAVLRPNARAQWLFMMPSLVVLLGALCAGAWSIKSGWSAVTVCAVLLGIASVTAFGFGLRSLMKPRIAIKPDYVEVNISNQPTLVPIDAVECFFLGQGPAGIPDKDGDSLETSNVIVRLAEKAVDWHKRDVSRYLGNWCEGYITVRGTWCEPISLELVNRLNHELAVTKRARKGQA